MKKTLFLYAAVSCGAFLLCGADKDRDGDRRGEERRGGEVRVEAPVRAAPAQPAPVVRPAAVIRIVRESPPPVMQRQEAPRSYRESAPPMERRPEGIRAMPEAPRAVAPAPRVTMPEAPRNVETPRIETRPEVIRNIRENAPPVETRPGGVTRDIRGEGPPVEVRPGGVTRELREAAPPIETRREGVTRNLRETAPPVETRPAGREGELRPAEPGPYGIDRVVVPEPPRFKRPEAVVNDERRAEEPRTTESGERIRERRENRPPEWHRGLMRDPGLVSEIKEEQRTETARDRYYWHKRGGTRYAHYYDGRGTHWYGFYRARRFYWCRYYAENWWWYDPLFARWVFWWDGYWWWWGPGGIAYVYLNSDYYPYSMENGTTVVEPPETASPPAPPDSPFDGQLWLTPDDSRLVQVYGDDYDCFLYDNTGDEPVYLAYLGRDVSDVRFTEGPPDRILVYSKNGTFALYDTDGNPQETPSTGPPQEEQPPQPGSLPPPPSIAPGE